ncbi:hypothetical protein CBER1_07097 [Cercospora berteroae]|uniref:beta-glucosidase n=1 Tax=Cercospora berteroae TaxID=357750 RepID=A0A2S6BTR9_9PEZI|nr:hypothetical protein CBER1_07097 [Cercospora berteroae]
MATAKLLLALLPLVSAQVDDVGPSAAPYPDIVYPNATRVTTGAASNQTSPPEYPSPWGEGLGDWADAYAKAQAFVSGLTLMEKVNLTTTGTAFQAGVSIAATWDRALLYQRGYDMGTEHKLKGVDVQLGPVVGPLGTAPEGGRNWEGFSPDLMLSGIAVAETIKGIQDAGIMACTKHYIMNEQEHFRQRPPPQNLTASYSSNLDDVTMHELYLWPFADAVKAGAASIMCSYNQINNSYGCQNSYTLNYLLKNELGFQFVMSDWGAHHSGVASTLAGMDMSMPGDVGFDSGTSYWGTNLTIAVLNSSVPTWRLDDMATRIVAGWYYVGRDQNQVENAPNFSSWTTDTYGFEHQYAQEGYGLVNYHVDEDHGANIRDSTPKGTVILKNNGVLPLSGKEKLTSVFGSDAGPNTWGPNGCSDRGCDNGTLALGLGSGSANFPYLITPDSAIQAEVVQNGKGFYESILDDYVYPQIAALARRADQVNGVCLAFVNSDAGEGYIIVDGNEGDRNNLTLWHAGDALIANVTSECSNTVVVIHSVGAVDVESFYDHPNVTAIVWAGLPGQESGNSIVDILSYGTDLLYSLNNGVEAPQIDFTAGIFTDYRGFDARNETPIYEFGYGLSWSTFSYSDLKITPVPSNFSYAPASGKTPAAPTYGTTSNDTTQYLCGDMHFVEGYVYPCLNTTNFTTASNDPEYGSPVSYPDGAYDGTAQSRLPAGGAPGGNPALWNVLFTVTATITNTGNRTSDEVPQLYVSLGGPNDAPKVLRGFDRITVAPGASATFTVGLTRRDISNWDPSAQNWCISSYAKKVYVGSSSRKLPLSGTLDISALTKNGTSYSR